LPFGFGNPIFLCDKPIVRTYNVTGIEILCYCGHKTVVPYIDRQFRVEGKGFLYVTPCCYMCSWFWIRYEYHPPHVRKKGEVFSIIASSPHVEDEEFVAFVQVGVKLPVDEVEEKASLALYQFCLRKQKVQAWKDMDRALFQAYITHADRFFRKSCLRLCYIEERCNIRKRIEVYDGCSYSLPCSVQGKIHGKGRFPDSPLSRGDCEGTVWKGSEGTYLIIAEGEISLGIICYGFHVTEISAEHWRKVRAWIRQIFKT